MKPEYYNSYLAMFNFLDKYWDEFQNDDFGILLSNMSPNIWGNKMPIDKSMYLDWENVLSEVGFIEVTSQPDINLLTLILLNIFLNKKKSSISI